MECFSSLKLARGANAYSLYVLALLLLAYLLNQLDRYTLAIVTKPAAQEIHYGEQGCMKNESIPVNVIPATTCSKVNTYDECLETNENGTFGCKWDYTGRGLDYQLLAGPVFIGIYTLAAIPVGIAADAYNRKILLGLSVVFWSVCTFLSGFVNSYWQLVVLRFGLGLGQAGCTPFATSLISDYFSEQLRGAALGVYNWGIYTGYSMSFALGNLITKANINGQGWRWVFFIAGIPGIFLGLLIMMTVKEPERSKTSKKQEESEAQGSEMTTCGRLCGVASSFCRPSILLLCLAGSIRNAAGYVWAYNTQIYYENIGQSREQIATWLAFVPMIGGSVGVLVGGFISDRFVVKSGPHGRIWVLIFSQMLAAPFAAGAILLPPPFAYMSLIPTYIIGEMWVSVTLAVLVELVPAKIKTTSIAIYFFIISNIGGNMPLMVAVLNGVFGNFGFNKLESLKYTLLTLYPGEYVLGSLLFMLTLFVLKRDIEYIQTYGGDKEDKAKLDIVTTTPTAAAGRGVRGEGQQQQTQQKEQTKM